jgi:hypothetical protein
MKTPTVNLRVIDGGARQWTIADIRRAFHPTYNQLPFITKHDGASDCATPASFWNDVPSGNSHADFRRGKQFANQVINAIASDKCGSRPLERTFEAIIKDAVIRKSKGGKYSRTLTPAVDAFLWELAKAIQTRAIA